MRHLMYTKLLKRLLKNLKIWHHQLIVIIEKEGAVTPNSKILGLGRVT